MDIGSLLLILSIAILAGFLVSRPFYTDIHSTIGEESPADENVATEEELSALLVKKDNILFLLQELDTDHSLRKIPEDRYQAKRHTLRNEAALILQRIDDLETRIQSADASKKETPRSSAVQISLSNTTDEIEEMIAARRRSRNEKSAGFCPHCGKVIQTSDRFCPACGSKVAE